MRGKGAKRASGASPLPFQSAVGETGHFCLLPTRAQVTSWPAEMHCAVAQPPVAAATLPLKATPKTMTKIMRRMYVSARTAALRNNMIVECGPARTGAMPP